METSGVIVFLGWVTYIVILLKSNFFLSDSFFDAVDRSFENKRKQALAEYEDVSEDEIDDV